VVVGVVVADAAGVCVADGVSVGDGVSIEACVGDSVGVLVTTGNGVPVATGVVALQPANTRPAASDTATSRLIDIFMSSSPSVSRCHDRQASQSAQVSHWAANIPYCFQRRA
jgi:hypothetical protein